MADVGGAKIEACTRLRIDANRVEELSVQYLDADDVSSPGREHFLNEGGLVVSKIDRSICNGSREPGLVVELADAGTASADVGLYQDWVPETGGGLDREA